MPKQAISQGLALDKPQQKIEQRAGKLFGQCTNQ